MRSLVPNNIRANNRTTFYILGKHELVGLEEIVDNSSRRHLSAVCQSTEAECYYLTKEDFIDIVN